jgi:hypothetical protein
VTGAETDAGTCPDNAALADAVVAKRAKSDRSAVSRMGRNM